MNTLPNKLVITGTSWNNTEFYFDTINGNWIQFDKADIWASDHFEASESDKEYANNINNKESIPLRNIRLRLIEM